MIFDTIKIAGAAIAAIALAALLRLDFAVSAGTVAILTIRPTKRETIQTASARLLAYLAALAVSRLCFRLWGFSYGAFFVFLAIYILLCQIFRWHSATVMHVVLVSHFLSLERMDLAAVINESLLFLIGVSVGIAANLHLRQRKAEMERLKTQMDRQVQEILRGMARRILDREEPGIGERKPGSGGRRSNGRERKPGGGQQAREHGRREWTEAFRELERTVRRAKNMAEDNRDNRLRPSDSADLDYTDMRARQMHILYEMEKSVSGLGTQPITAGRIADFLERIADVGTSDAFSGLLQEFYRMNEEMRARPLPTERQEFEDRARLFILLRYIEEFLLLQRSFEERAVYSR